MRLLHTTRHDFVEFYDDGTPPYAILSHTWTAGQEVTYQEWLNHNDIVRARVGYRKIQDACRQARKDELEWIWIDTICIDKSSSAELSEAINSMFAWYRDAAVCYVFLADVPPVADHPRDDNYLPFRHSRWWGRGWTLQELLAPSSLAFFAADWSFIETRENLAGQVKLVTGIAAEDCKREIRKASVARKMSWLSQRKTTRVEDLAYCMLGLFDINMPLLYGEGSKAFVRLQEEIIKRNPDQTIFCWTRDDLVPPNWLGMLAPSPHVFVNSGGFRRISYLEDLYRDASIWSITNRGLSISLPIVHTCEGALIWLHEARAHDDLRTMIAIPISGRSWTTHGYYRLPIPCGPIVFPSDESSPFMSGMSGMKSLTRLHLLPTYDVSSPTITQVCDTRDLEAERSGQRDPRLQFVLAADCPGFWTAYAHTGSERVKRGNKLTMIDTIPAPASALFDQETGLLQLVRVSAGSCKMLAAALEIKYSRNSMSHGPYSYLRILLAFKEPLNAPGEHRGHYCRVTEYDMDSVEESNRMAYGGRELLRLWFESQLDQLGKGELRAQPSVISSQNDFALRVLDSMASCTSGAIVTARLEKKARRGLNIARLYRKVTTGAS
ncbi:heterokaryon incompatibility protein-domain-containing protein [Microdochium trichocladiopsis]|uniref:Heterokaryon incompatibility protein-domain-containing protein n=1 Tax=Microdochium trichocladiopsis TaxID=1682393 RepID=A0A9P9BU04_9PEZI|nr:heterokaryon incompatibility protein-domain-containing protein [Microdochium trichocladiopsis]KAH7036002.1 heterokaryon incompatibility protein-domain-containing protein [Microdochium trichocladiopsis]